VALVAMIAPLPLTQDGRISPPATTRGNIQAASTLAGTEPLVRRGPGNLFFCPPKTCLYYAGDFDSADYNAYALYNADSEGAGLEGQVWVGVKPTRDVIVSGGTFNQILYGQLGTNPTPFIVQVGIKPGQPGKTICNTSGNATERPYQEFDWGIVSSYTIKKLSKPCKLKKGTTYYVNLLPTYSNGFYGYVSNVEDAKPANHRGWKNILDDSYFNGAAFGANYQPTWSSNGACKGNGCDAFSIALTGKVTK
jgi:hypothetical protein